MIDSHGGGGGGDGGGGEGFCVRGRERERKALDEWNGTEWNEARKE